MRVNRYQNGGSLQKDPSRQFSSNEQGEITSDERRINISDLMRGVSEAESAGGILMINPYSSATGQYGQLYSEIKDLPFMQGVSRDEFSKDKDLQDAVFQMRVEGNLPNVPSLEKNAYDLTDEYAPQLGDKWNFTLDEVAAISNYLGRQGARQYFASIRDGVEYMPKGLNKPVAEYLNIYRQGRDAN